MHRIYQNVFLLFLILTSSVGFAQNDSTELSQIFHQKYPREYTLSGIDVVGTKAFDPNLIISISGLAIGDKIKFPVPMLFQKLLKNYGNKTWFPMCTSTSPGWKAATFI